MKSKVDIELFLRTKRKLQRDYYEISWKLEQALAFSKIVIHFHPFIVSHPLFSGFRFISSLNY